jgi:hypothetical protein
MRNRRGIGYRISNSTLTGAAESRSAFTGRTTASCQAEFARLEHLLPVFVKQHQHFGLDRYGENLALSRFKMNALEAMEALGLFKSVTR